MGEIRREKVLKKGPNLFDKKQHCMNVPYVHTMLLSLEKVWSFPFLYHRTKRQKKSSMFKVAVSY